MFIVVVVNVIVVTFLVVNDHIMSELKTVGRMGSMLSEHPRCFPGTQKVSNYLKCVWSMASTDPYHNFCINISIYYFYPPMVQNNEFILLCTLLFCNVRLRNQFWLQEHFRTFFSSIAWYWTVFYEPVWSG